MPHLSLNWYRPFTHKLVHSSIFKILIFLFFSSVTYGKPSLRHWSQLCWLCGHSNKTMGSANSRDLVMKTIFYKYKWFNVYIIFSISAPCYAMVEISPCRVQWAWDSTAMAHSCSPCAVDCLLSCMTFTHDCPYSSLTTRVTSTLVLWKAAALLVTEIR